MAEMLAVAYAPTWFVVLLFGGLLFCVMVTLAIALKRRY